MTMPFTPPDVVAAGARQWLAAYRRRDRVAPELGEGPWRMLLVLADEGPVSLSSLGLGAGASATTGLRYAEELAARGLITLVPHPTDRRSRLAVLADPGRALLESVL